MDTSFGKREERHHPFYVLNVKDAGRHLKQIFLKISAIKLRDQVARSKIAVSLGRDYQVTSAMKYVAKVKVNLRPRFQLVQISFLPRALMGNTYTSYSSESTIQLS